ncbi:MAG: hypothetical protein EBV34_14120 [Betaproteobacteria bacterium]|nr:hypothetical protein [Betaproteobacteria bacterium]
MEAAVGHLSLIFKERGYDLPQVKVSCGFAHTSSNRVIGQCWSTKTSDAGVNEIFISPKLADPVEVLDTLTHELVQSAAHRNRFKTRTLPARQARCT